MIPTTLNFHHLHYFWTVAREGSIATAARTLGVSQPTSSAQLRLLEQQFGERLFDRRGRGLALTEIGQVALRYADEIFALGRELESTVSGRPTGRPVRFAVGVSDALPKLTTYRLLRPALALPEPPRLLLRVGKTDALLDELAAHRLDLVLTDAPASGSFRARAYHHLLGESAVTIFAPPAMAARLRRGFPGSLEGAPFLLHGEHTMLRRSLDHWFAQEDLRPLAVAEVEDGAILQVLGQAGLGCFAAPSVVEREIERQYGVRAIGRPAGVRERFYAVSVERKLKHPALVALAEAARSTFAGAAPR